MTAPFAAGPLQFTFWLTTQVSFVTTVTGDQRNTSTVQIYSGSMIVWSGTMTQASKTAEISMDLFLGDATISKGSSFTMQIPTTQQDGNVLFSGKVGSGSNPPVPFSAYIATWKLTSAA